MRHRQATLLIAAALATVAGGCANTMWYPGGPLASRDQFTYESVAHYAQTVSLVDTRTDQVIWTAEVPVDKELVLRFYKDEGDANRVTPDQMVWDVWPIGQRSGTPEFKLNVPPADCRRLDVALRPIPEFPVDMKPIEVPMPNLPFPSTSAGR